jgi:hypothetical protein
MKYLIKKYISSIVLGILVVSVQSVSHAQTGATEGYFTSEANMAANDNNVFISIKKYNPTQNEIDNAAKPSRNTPMNYLMAPFEATGISMYNKGFESKLYALDKTGKPLWDITLGHSDKSVPSPMQLYKDFLFAGEVAKDADKVTVQKIDLAGKVVWKTELDSLNNVNAIYVDDTRVSVLVSFDVSKKITHGNGTFSERVYPIYFFVQLDIATGKRIVSNYQKMANYLSSLGFSNPLLNSDYSYYLSNTDSVIFLNVTKLESATVVSQGMSKANTILKVAVGKESYHLLTLLSTSRNKKRYNLINDFYGKAKKSETAMPIDYNSSDRNFIYKTSGDSVAVIVGNERNIVIIYADIEGKTALYKKVDNVISPLVGVCISADKVYILQMEGRMKSGTIGKLKLDVY